MAQEAGALSGAVREILEDPAESVARAQRGRDWAGRSLVAEALAPRYVSMYRELIDGSDDGGGGGGGGGA